LAAALALSCAGAVNPGESFVAWLDWLAALAVLLTAANVLRSEAELDDFLMWLSPLFFIELIVNLAQRDPRHPFASQPPGTLINSNAATAFLIGWVPVFVDRFRRQTEARMRRFWAAVLAANVAGCLLFISSWGMLCLLAALPFLSGPRGLAAWIRRRPRLIAAVAATAAVGAALLLRYKLTHALDFDGATVPAGRNTARIMWWASGLRMFWEHPWLGVGLGNYPSAYISYKVGTGQHTLSAHSFPVKMLAETGLIGAGAWLALLAAWRQRLVAGWTESFPRWPFILGILLFLGYSIISMGMEYLSHLLALGLFLGISIGRMPAPRWKPRRVILVAVTATGLATIPYLIAPFLASRLWVGAQGLLAAGDAAGAERGFAAAAESFPLSFEAQRGWAQARFARGDAAGAIAHQSRAIRLNSRMELLRRELEVYRGSAQ
jgi:O-antigen ligase